MSGIAMILDSIPKLKEECLMLRTLSVLMLPMGLMMLGAGAEPEEQAPVKLEHTFQSGEPIRYKAISDRTSVQSGMGQVVSSNEEHKSVISRELIETREDGTLVVAEKREQYGYYQRTDSTVFEFDSSKEEDQSKRDDERVRAAMTRLDWDVAYLMSPMGEILGIANEAELEGQAQKIEDETLRAEVMTQLASAALIKEANPVTMVIPEHAVAVGDSWDVSYTVQEGPIVFEMKRTMTVAGIIDWKEGKRVRVDIAGTIEFELPANFPSFMKITNNSIEGWFVFNTHLGTVTDYKAFQFIAFGGSPGEDMPGVYVSSSATTRYDMIPN